MFHNDLEVQYTKLVLMKFRVSLIINFLYPPFKWNKFKLVHKVQNKLLRLSCLWIQINYEEITWVSVISWCNIKANFTSTILTIQSSYFPITTVWWTSSKVTHLKICFLSWVTNFTHCLNNNSFYSSPLQVVAKCLEGSV